MFHSLLLVLNILHSTYCNYMIIDLVTFFYSLVNFVIALIVDYMSDTGDKTGTGTGIVIGVGVGAVLVSAYLLISNMRWYRATPATPTTIFTFIMETNKPIYSDTYNLLENRLHIYFKFLPYSFLIFLGCSFTVGPCNYSVVSYSAYRGMPYGRYRFQVQVSAQVHSLVELYIKSLCTRFYRKYRHRWLPVYPPLRPLKPSIFSISSVSTIDSYDGDPYLLNRSSSFYTYPVMIIGFNNGTGEYARVTH